MFKSTFLVLMAALPTQAGISGAGNTGDFSLQMYFARTTAALIVQTVSPRQILDVSGSEKLQSTYQRCQEALFAGIIKTTFEFVPDIPDVGPHHAFARRLADGKTEISLRKLDELSKNGEMTGPYLTGMVLHEAFHDCYIDGKQLDDESDPLINEISEALIRAAGSHSSAYVADYKFVDKVKQGHAVLFLELSSQLRTQLVEKYLDYVGDWAYLQNQGLFSLRPQRASQFYSSDETSWFPGWGTLQLPARAPLPLQRVVQSVLKAGYDRKNTFSFYDQGKLRSLPVQLDCRFQQKEHNKPSEALCELFVLWSPLPEMELKKLGQNISFSVDSLGRLNVRRIRFI